MRRTCRNTLLVTMLIGVAACDERAPTAVSPIAPTPPRPLPSAEFATAVAMLGRPLPRLSAAQRLRFDMGRAVFATEFTPETGLGPLFNAVGCAACHENPVPGGGGSNDPEEGGEDIELHATATLREFNGDAFVMEMGITNPVNQTEQTVGGEPLPAGVDPLPEPEISAAQFDAANAFVRFLAPPPRAPLDPVGVLGTLVFAKIGCSACHVPALVTGARRQSRRPSRSTAGRASGHETGSSGCRASSGPRCCSSSGRCSRYDPFRTNVIVATGFTRPPTTKCRVAARDVAFLGLVSLSAAL